MDQQAGETPTWKERNTELDERGREQYRLQVRSGKHAVSCRKPCFNKLTHDLRQ